MRRLFFALLLIAPCSAHGQSTGTATQIVTFSVLPITAASVVGASQVVTDSAQGVIVLTQVVRVTTNVPNVRLAVGLAVPAGVSVSAISCTGRPEGCYFPTGGAASMTVRIRLAGLSRAQVADAIAHPDALGSTLVLSVLRGGLAE
jgi:hypothetical protein